MTNLQKAGNIGQETGIVFHIIHGSFVDGYGIRTTVFLKGCPLRCVWCCNPEGQLGNAEIKFTTSLCNTCGKCLKVCSLGAIQLEAEIIKVNRGLCTNCGKCLEVCYTGALDYFGKCMTVDEVFNIVKTDEQYYRTSGGGVTIGGGEPTFQAAFTLAIVRKCRENYIHTAIDTCGYTHTEDGLKILEEADLLLYDLKHIDPIEHQKYTGVSNELIISNLEKMNNIGKSIIIRIPLIPGYNDSSENIQASAEFLSGLKSVERVDLLAYHIFGKIKYEQLGRKYPLNVLSLSDEHLNNIKQTFENYGLKVQLGG